MRGFKQIFPDKIDGNIADIWGRGEQGGAGDLRERWPHKSPRELKVGRGGAGRHIKGRIKSVVAVET